MKRYNGKRVQVYLDKELPCCFGKVSFRNVCHSMAKLSFSSKTRNCYQLFHFPPMVLPTSLKCHSNVLTLIQSKVFSERLMFDSVKFPFVKVMAHCEIWAGVWRTSWQRQVTLTVQLPRQPELDRDSVSNQNLQTLLLIVFHLLVTTTAQFERFKRGKKRWGVWWQQIILVESQADIHLEEDRNQS